MSLSVYEVSVQSLRKAMCNLITILHKGEKYAKERDIEEKVLTHTRLFPDMLPLYRQVYIATDLTARCAARLAGLNLPRYADTEETFVELIERVHQIVSFLDEIDARQINNAADSEIKFRGGGQTRKASGRDYLLTFILPNVYFHITTTYNILRHCGVALGKKDYTGEF
jgi:hypothetical protein